MALGISSSCYYPMETEKAVRHLADAGVQDIEIFFNARCETKGPILRKISSIVRSEGMRVRAVHPYFTFCETYLLFGGYERRFQDGMELYRELCETCSILGADILNIHGEREPFRLEENAYFDHFGKLSAMTKENGVRLSQENVVRFRSQNPDFLRRMRDALKSDFHMTLDVKQAVRSSVDVMALAKEFSREIVHVHLSDHGERGDCLLPGCGSFDFSQLFRILHDAEYKGHYVLELYRQNYKREEDLLLSYKNLQKIL